MTGAVAVATAALLEPATAQAAPAACGTTLEQWYGTYEGSDQFEYQYNVEVRITDHRDGHPEYDFYVDVTEGGYDHSPTSGPALSGDTMTWNAYYDHFVPINRHFAHQYEYTTTDVTCAGGRVTAISGTIHAYYYPTGTERDGTFSISR